MLTKVELREKAKQIRNSLDMEKISEKIVKQVRRTQIYQEFQNIMIFYPLKNEVNLLPLLEDNKNFYLPKLKGKDMVVCPYKSGDKMTISGFKTKEPVSNPINPEVLELIFIPALMVDRNFQRLGYGKGFYDRFLTKNALKAIKIVPIPSDLIIDEIPSDAFDVKVDAILDESFM